MVNKKAFILKGLTCRLGSLKQCYCFFVLIAKHCTCYCVRRGRLVLLMSSM
jgi:hypothetical protein